MIYKRSQNLYKYLLLVQNSFFLKSYLNLALFTYGINLYDVELAIKSNFFRKANFFLLKSSFYRLGVFRDLMVKDTLGKSSRFLLVYNYLSVKYSLRCFVTLVGGNHSYIFKSINGLYSSSIWVEREAWDMFGVWFIDNVDMRRILTDYGFQGHPLRKDFPLSGFKEISYKESFKRLVYSNVVLSQEYRFFHFSPHWRLA